MSLNSYNDRCRYQVVRSMKCYILMTLSGMQFFSPDHSKMKILQAIVKEARVTGAGPVLQRIKRDTRTLTEHLKISQDLLIATISLGVVLGLLLVILVVVRVRKCMKDKNRVTKALNKGIEHDRKSVDIRNKHQPLKHGRERTPRFNKTARSKMNTIVESEA